MQKFVSIIIPVRTFTNYLKESIPYLRSITYKNYEVLIITDSVENFPKLPRNFKILASGAVGPAEKRNLGARHAKGAILAFMDDDAFPAKNWLENAVPNFDDESICAVGGPSITPPNERFLERASGEVLASYLASAGTVHRHVPLTKMFVDDFPTVNLFVLKSAFKKIKGFASEFWPGEDTKLCLDLIKQTGKKILYDPIVVVYHHRRKLFIPHLKQISRYGMHRGQFAKIFPETSRKPMYFVPGLFVLGLVFGPISAFISSSLFYVYLFTIYVYLSLVFLEASRVVLTQKKVKLGLYFIAGIFSTHLVYGFSFLYGLLKKPTLNLRAYDKVQGKYLGG